MSFAVNADGIAAPIKPINYERESIRGDTHTDEATDERLLGRLLKCIIVF